MKRFGLTSLKMLIYGLLLMIEAKKIVISTHCHTFAKNNI